MELRRWFEEGAEGLHLLCHDKCIRTLIDQSEQGPGTSDVGGYGEITNNIEELGTRSDVRWGDCKSSTVSNANWNFIEFSVIQCIHCGNTCHVLPTNGVLGTVPR